jgi:hypothetical protein
LKWKPKGIIIAMSASRKPFLTVLFLSWEQPLRSFGLALVMYWGYASLAGPPWRLSPYPYFNYLADAFWHGQLFLRLLPTNTLDLSLYHGHYYLYWPPMPAIMLMPLVAIWGVMVSDVMISVLLGALEVALVASLLRAGQQARLFDLSAEMRGMITLFFALGTSFPIVAVTGRVWYLAQVFGFGFVGLAYLTALRWRGPWSGLALGLWVACASLTRNHLALVCLWPLAYGVAQHWGRGRRTVLYLSLVATPLVLFGLAFLAYNLARFGNPLELGIRYHQMAYSFQADYAQYGAFNWHYVPVNFYYQYIYYPFPITTKEFAMGGSLFLLSPPFLYAWRALWCAVRQPWVVLWGVVSGLTALPILLLMGTGWVQFGPRYTLDFTVPLLLLTARGSEGASRPLWLLSLMLSILHYAVGAYLFSML